MVRSTARLVPSLAQSVGPARFHSYSPAPCLLPDNGSPPTSHPYWPIKTNEALRINGAFELKNPDHAVRSLILNLRSRRFQLAMLNERPNAPTPVHPRRGPTQAVFREFREATGGQESPIHVPLRLRN